ncbi:MAG: NfeD family protein [Candidatus Promineifilaceae bacterium]
MRHRALVLFLSLLALALVDLPARAQSETVIVLDVSGPITPAVTGYLARGIDRAETDGAAAVVLQLDTPGGLLDATQDIVQLLRAAELPIIVYVAPRGAQAASAGSIITMAGHAAAMAPETVIGAASPVSDDGADLEETLFRKVSEDLKATTRNLTAGRGVEATDLAQAMIEEARAVTAEEALQSGLIDFIALDIPDLLLQLDNHTVTVNERPFTLQTAAATAQPLPPSPVEQVLLALANPLLLGILLTLGVQAILIELSSPGGWVAGTIGVIAVGLALYGLGQLPVNWLGLGLILLAFVLFFMEVKAATHGALALTGTALLIGGLLVLFNTPVTPDYLAISLPAAAALGGFTAAFFLFVVSKALGAQRAPALTGAEGLIGQTGPARSSFSSDVFSAPYTGSVLVAGELWRARATEKIQRGERVIVTGKEGFTLDVRRLEE